MPTGELGTEHKKKKILKVSDLFGPDLSRVYCVCVCVSVFFSFLFSFFNFCVCVWGGRGGSHRKNQVIDTS